MTLSTTIRLLEPYPVREILDQCNRILGAVEPSIKDEPVPFSSDGRRWLMNEPGQGLPAWVLVVYGPDAPLKQDMSDWEDEPPVNMPLEYTVDIDFDTTYSYEGPNGGGCADLHAWLITQIGPWLDDRRLTWFWEDEFTGEWFKGLDNVLSLGNPEKGALQALVAV